MHSIYWAEERGRMVAKRSQPACNVAMTQQQSVSYNHMIAAEVIYDYDSGQIDDDSSDVDDVMMIVLDVGAVSALGQKVVTMLKSSQLAGISFNWSKTKRINIRQRSWLSQLVENVFLCSSPVGSKPTMILFLNNFNIFTFLLVPSLPPLKKI